MPITLCPSAFYYKQKNRSPDPNPKNCKPDDRSLPETQWSETGFLG
ncbi:MAG TPA: hypothetical protein IGS31_19330 [Oscillatoriales cyanobacterium M4454_W2019_049]|nr:hypothetical protein [Oscillatoriales cyanobacterium M4454_W2019_049]